MSAKDENADVAIHPGCFFRSDLAELPGDGRLVHRSDAQSGRRNRVEVI